MARRRSQAVSLDFAFFTELHRFYKDNRGFIRQHYRDLSKKFLDHNDPTNAGAISLKRATPKTPFEKSESGPGSP